MNIPVGDKPLREVTVDPSQLGDVRAWSYSTLKTYEQCPYRVYIQKVRKIREPSSPAAERGSLIHQEAEDYVRGELGEMPESLKKFESEFEVLREGFADAKVELEGEWGFTLDWETTGWLMGDTWARIKLDALVNEDETSCRVIDYKTGKKFGNEIAHGQQGLVYAIATFLRYPHIEHARTEFWYLDKGETTTKQYTRAEAMQFAPGFHSRAIKMTTCDDFVPKPSQNACKWCSYKKGDDPECVWGVLQENPLLPHVICGAFFQIGDLNE